MTQRGNENLRACITLLQANGAAQIEHRHGGKHIRLTWLFGDRPMRATMAVSPSDWRAKRNNIAQLKRQLRTVEAK